MKENLKKRAEQEKNMKNCLKTLNFNMALMGHHRGVNASCKSCTLCRLAVKNATTISKIFLPK